MNTPRDHIILGEKHGYGEPVDFGISRKALRQHLYVVGKTGTGKTTLLKNLIIQDIEAGRGVGVIDAHGDLASELLDHVPSHRADDLVYFNAGDIEHPIGFNLLASVEPDRRPIVASGVVAAFKAIWGEASWGPRLEYILYASVAALLDCQNTTLLGVQRILTDSKYRRWVVKQVKDPMVRSFWVDQFECWDTRFRTEAISPVLNKVGQLLMAGPVRNILGQVKRKICPRFMMDRKRIFIANLSKGAIGDDKAGLLGALLVAGFQQAAMSRVDQAEEQREDFHLVVDEFQNFATESFASILSEARKYRLALTLSHQFSSQLREPVRDAVFGNVGTVVAFRVGHADARILENEFGGHYLASQFVELDNFRVYVKPITNDGSGQPFMGRTVAAPEPSRSRREKLVAVSRQKYGLKREEVEDKIERWLK